MMVAEMLRRNRKMTMITRNSVSTSVNFTSLTEARIVMRAVVQNVQTSTEAGISAWKLGSSCLMLSTTSTVLVPGWRWIARTTDGATPSSTSPRSCRSRRCRSRGRHRRAAPASRCGRRRSAGDRPRR